MRTGTKRVMRSLVAVFAGATVLAQQPPDPSVAVTPFAQSLSLRADRVIVDSTHTAMIWLAQTAPVPYTSESALQLTVELRSTGEHPALVKPLGVARLFGGNLATQPFPFAVDLQGVADGDYQYVAEVQDGGTQLKRVPLPVKLVAGLDERQADTERRLSKISGHESAKATNK